MIKLTDYGKINHLLDQIKIEKVYPLSIIEGGIRQLSYSG